MQHVLIIIFFYIKYREVKFIYTYMAAKCYRQTQQNNELHSHVLFSLQTKTFLKSV